MKLVSSLFFVSFLTRARQQKLPYNQWPEKSPAIGPECNAGASGQRFSVLNGPFFWELRVGPVFSESVFLLLGLQTEKRCHELGKEWHGLLCFESADCFGKKGRFCHQESWPWHAYIVCTCVMWWDQKLNRSSWELLNTPSTPYTRY